MRNKLKNLTAITLALALGLAVVGVWWLGCGGTGTCRATGTGCACHARTCGGTASSARYAGCRSDFRAGCFVCARTGCTCTSGRTAGSSSDHSGTTSRHCNASASRRCPCRTRCAGSSTAIAEVVGAESGWSGRAVTVGGRSSWWTTRCDDFRGLRADSIRAYIRGQRFDIQPRYGPHIVPSGAELGAVGLRCGA